MSAAPSLPDLKARGIELWVEGGTLRYRAAAGVLTPDLLTSLKDAKPQIMAGLKLEAAATEACRSLSGYITPTTLLAKLAPADLAGLCDIADPAPYLRSLATALVWTAMRRQGIAPPDWMHPATCDRCGPVYLWAPLHVQGCPWCWNRLHKLPIPRPPEKTIALITTGDAITTEAHPCHGGKTPTAPHRPGGAA